MKANQKVIDAHEKDWKNLGEKSAIAHAGKFKLLDKDIGLRGFEYPNNPLSLNKFSLWGNKFSRVWAPVRFGLFAVTLPFRALYFPLQFAGRFSARMIGRYQTRTSPVRAEAYKLANDPKNKMSFAAAKKEVRRKREALLAHMESAKFKKDTAGKGWRRRQYDYDKAVEENKILAHETEEGFLDEQRKTVRRRRA
jgi:hypothetical protein